MPKVYGVQISNRAFKRLYLYIRRADVEKSSYPTRVKCMVSTEEYTYIPLNTNLDNKCKKKKSNLGVGYFWLDAGDAVDMNM